MTATLTAQRMHELAGRGRPLREGCFPVPVQLDGQWQHAPAQPPPDVDPDAFVPAPAIAADGLARLAARRCTADPARQRHDAGGPP